jgi:hypothetical protein
MKFKFSRRLFSWFVSIAALPFLVACASGASIEGMTFQPTGATVKNAKLQRSLVIHSVNGGKETNPLWSSQISNADFQQALSRSIINSGFESEQPENARYYLTATVKNVDQPWFGFDMTVETVINYVMTDKRTERVVLNYDVTARHTAKLGEAIYGATRLKLANEGSAKKNISQLISTLQDLDPDKVENLKK